MSTYHLDVQEPYGSPSWQAAFRVAHTIIVILVALTMITIASATLLPSPAYNPHLSVGAE